MRDELADEGNYLGGSGEGDNEAPSRPSESSGWAELHAAVTDLMSSFTATGPKFERVRDALRMEAG